MRKPIIYSAVLIITLLFLAISNIQAQTNSALLQQLHGVIKKEKQLEYYKKLPKINLNAINQPLGIVMQNFAVLTNYSLSFQDGVNLNTPVTIRLVNTPIREALENILYPIGYSFKLDNNYHRIIVTAFVSKNITIPPSIIDDEDVKYTFSSTGEVGKTGSSGSSGGSQTEGGKTEATGKIDVKDSVKGKDAIKSLLNHVRAILSDKGVVSLDPITGSLYVRDYRPYVQNVEKYVKQWINEFSKEVYVKAYIVDVMLDKDHEYGIDWNTIQKDILRHSTTINFTQTATSIITSPTGTLTLNNGSQANPFNLVIKALASQGNVKVLSEPRIVIMNHEIGYIQSGDSIPYVSDIQENYIGDQGTNAQTTYQISRVLEGVTLAIKPHIIGNNKIDLTIIPTLSSIKGWSKLTVGDSTIDNPIITTRNSYTKLVVNNGEFFVIGGAETNTNKVTKVRIPILGDIPILGGLFGVTTHQKSKSVMLVLLQARIVDAETARKLQAEARKAVKATE